MMQPDQSYSAFDEALAMPFFGRSQTGGSTNSATWDPNLFDNEDSSLSGGALQLVEMETVVFDNALLQERHSEIQVMNDSMKQINVISEEFAGLVDSQQDDIEQLSWKAIGTFENTNSSLEQVVKAAKYTELYTRSEKRKTILLTLLIAMCVLGVSWAVIQTSNVASEGKGGDFQIPMFSANQDQPYTQYHGGDYDP